VDEGLRELQRAAAGGDPTARARLLYEANRLGVFGQAHRGEHVDQPFVMVLQLLGFLGDPDARAFLKERGLHWLTKLGPDIMLPYGNYVAARLAIAAARFALASFASLPLSERSSSAVVVDISNGTEILEHALSVLQDMEARRDGEVFRRAFPDPADQTVAGDHRRRLHAVVTSISCAYPTGSGITLASMSSHEACVSARRTALYVATAGWHDFSLALDAIDRAINARAQVLAVRAGHWTPGLGGSWMDYRRRAHAQVKEAMRRELTLWITGGLLSAGPPLAPNPPFQVREVESFRCPWCHEELAPQEAVFCPACGAPQHYACAEETARCGVCRAPIPSDSWDTLEERAEREAGYGRAIGRPAPGLPALPKKDESTEEPEETVEAEYLEDLQQDLERRDTPGRHDAWAPASGSRRRRRPVRPPEPPKQKTPPRRPGRWPHPVYVERVKGGRRFQVAACPTCPGRPLLERIGSSAFRCASCGTIYEDPKAYRP